MSGFKTLAAPIAPIALVCLGISVASAQPIQPPGRIRGGPLLEAGQGAANSAALLLRINRLEKRMRSLTGDIEQMQFQMRKMREQLLKFQKDVDFRLRGKTGPRSDAPKLARRGDTLRDDRPRREDKPPRETRLPQENRLPPATRRGDAFDPDRQPDALGAPRQLGTTIPSKGVVRLPAGPVKTGPLRTGPRENIPRSRNEPDGSFDPDRPVDLSGRGRVLPNDAAPSVGIVRPRLPDNAAPPRETYRIALAALKRRRYSDAEVGFKSFLKRFPKSTLAVDAIFNLGETYSRSGQRRQAAEQFLKVSTNYKKSRRAPSSLYRLGLALEKLGAKEQACASYSEVEKRYPLAPGRLRVAVERQMRRAKC